MSTLTPFACALYTRALTEDPTASKALISVDTFYGSVAKEAVESGAHIINDVSGGTLDEDMFHTVGRIQCYSICTFLIVPIMLIMTPDNHPHMVGLQELLYSLLANQKLKYTV